MLSMLPHVVTGPSEADYERLQRRLVHPSRIHEEPTFVHAYVSDGRWVADCGCGAASLVHPAYRVARCAECGAVSPLVFPDHHEQIAALLVARRRLGTREWRGESLTTMATQTPGLGLRGDR